MRVALTDKAIDDLATLRLYLEDAGSLHAAAIIARLTAACQTLATLPKRGVMWRLSSGRPVWRLLVERHFIVYEIGSEKISVLRILHAHRDIRDIFRLDEPDDD